MTVVLSLHAKIKTAVEVNRKKYFKNRVAYFCHSNLLFPINDSVPFVDDCCFSSFEISSKFGWLSIIVSVERIWKWERLPTMAVWWKLCWILTWKLTFQIGLLVRVRVPASFSWCETVQIRFRSSIFFQKTTVKISCWTKAPYLVWYSEDIRRGRSV